MEMKLRELSSVYSKILFKQVIAVSVETMRIVAGLPDSKID